MNRRNFIADISIGLSAMIFAPKIVLPQWKPLKSSWKDDMIRSMKARGWHLDLVSGIWTNCSYQDFRDGKTVFFWEAVNFPAVDTGSYCLTRHIYSRPYAGPIPFPNEMQEFGADMREKAFNNLQSLHRSGSL